MFTSCGSLETIYATSFSNSGLSGSLMFNSCNRLVGGTDGFVPPTTSGASVCKLGAGGVLTDPNDDRRTWFWAHFYADGEGVLTASSTPDATREIVASGRICAIGKYVGLGFTPWDGVTGPTHRQHLTSASFAADMATFSYLNFNYLFYSCTNLASVNGLGNLSGVRSMRYSRDQRNAHEQARSLPGARRGEVRPLGLRRRPRRGGPAEQARRQLLRARPVHAAVRRLDQLRPRPPRRQQAAQEPARILVQLAGQVEGILRRVHEEMPGQGHEVQVCPEGHGPKEDEGDLRRHARRGTVFRIADLESSRETAPRPMRRGGASLCPNLSFSLWKTFRIPT